MVCFSKLRDSVHFDYDKDVTLVDLKMKRKKKKRRSIGQNVILSDCLEEGDNNFCDNN